MSSKRQIYLVYACDEWKTRNSMRLELATTSVRRLGYFLRQKILSGDYDYGNKALPTDKQTANFIQDFRVGTMEYINGQLQYGFCDCVSDGEEI